MAKVNLNNLSVEELDKLAKEAKTQAKIKRNQEKQATIIKLGNLAYKNIDPLLESKDLDFNLRKSIAKIVSRQIDKDSNIVKESSTATDKVDT